MSSIYTDLRRELSSALGEASSENCWVDAGIAVEIVRQRLERLMAGAAVQCEGHPPIDGSEFIRAFLAVPADKRAAL